MPALCAARLHPALTMLLVLVATAGPVGAQPGAGCGPGQDAATCQREARNAKAAQRRGGLDTPGDLQFNALARCTPLGGEDKAACEARVMGDGVRSGSVEGGGLLREAETVVMPPGATEITIRPRDGRPVVVLPSTGR